MGNEKKKIVVVDDNIEILSALKNTLKNIYEVYSGLSASKMFDLLKHIKPDIILLDVEMPEMDGYEALQKLKSDAQYREIPVIFLTSMNDEESRKKGFDLGAVDYIRKPFDTPSLLERLETHLVS
ncbi:MAG: response regulator [Treponema sp.]|jgi:putative two-component system response regulator|nr:response regulator [Treponema sp.]